MFEKDETTEGTKEVVPQTEATLPEEILPDNNEAETE
jgi:hypothetical protein